MQVTNKILQKEIAPGVTVGDFAAAVVHVQKQDKAARPKRKRTYDVPEGAVCRAEAEELLDMAPMDVSKLIREGKLKPYGSPRKQWFYKNEVDRLKE